MSRRTSFPDIQAVMFEGFRKWRSYIQLMQPISSCESQVSFQWWDSQTEAYGFPARAKAGDDCRMENSQRLMRDDDRRPGLAGTRCLRRMLGLCEDLTATTDHMRTRPDNERIRLPHDLVVLQGIVQH